MIDPVTGGPHTAHTSNPVPFLLLHEGFRGPLRERRLAARRRPHGARPARPRAAGGDDGPGPARGGMMRNPMAPAAWRRWDCWPRAALLAAAAPLAAQVGNRAGPLPVPRPDDPAVVHPVRRPVRRQSRRRGRRLACRDDGRRSGSTRGSRARWTCTSPSASRAAAATGSTPSGTPYAPDRTVQQDAVPRRPRPGPERHRRQDVAPPRTVRGLRRRLDAAQRRGDRHRRLQRRRPTSRWCPRSARGSSSRGRWRRGSRCGTTSSATSGRCGTSSPSTGTATRCLPSCRRTSRTSSGRTTLALTVGFVYGFNF